MKTGVAFFYQFFHSVRQEIAHDIEESIASSIVQFGVRGQSRVYTDEYIQSSSIVGKAIPHIHIATQTNGAAKYAIDMSVPEGGFHAAVVTATVAHARIKSIDPSAALAHPDVRAFYSAKDVPGKNLYGLRKRDEEFLASEEIVYYGQPVGIVVATSRASALSAIREVKVEVEPLEIVNTVEDAVKANSFFFEPKEYVHGTNPEELFPSCDVVVEGECRTGGQQAFYLENLNALCIPSAYPSFLVYSTTQSPSNVHACVSDILGVSENNIEVRVSRYAIALLHLMLLSE